MAKKIIFLNTGWMQSYQGLSNDQITGGGKHVKETGWGSEIFNFKAFRKKVYGYVQPKIDKKFHNPSTIKIEKLGAAIDDESINGVTVVWTASRPQNAGTVIVGWFLNATVYRYFQKAPNNSNRNYKGHTHGYFVKANQSDSKLLPIDQRTVAVERHKKGWMGQSNVWYADKNPSFISTVEKYIFEGITPQITRKLKKKSPGFPHQPDPLKRVKVEKKAILIVSNFYRKLGYEINSFEKDNVGWDLLATNGKIELQLEVKGLSGCTINTELTPNEYQHLKKCNQSYRLCIVRNALTNPLLSIFAYSAEYNVWLTEENETLIFKELVSARVSV